MLGWGFGGGFMMIIFWVFFIVFLVWIVKQVQGGNRSGSQDEKSPHDTLKERYAKGEIDKKEFEEKKRDIM
ncbi:MAG: SHOCT domain-containing protein [Patescibacteria group bacterium]